MSRTLLLALTLAAAGPGLSGQASAQGSLLDAPGLGAPDIGSSDLAGLPSWATPAEAPPPVDDALGGPNPFPGGTPPQGVPADGGLVALALAGALFAARRLRRSA